MFMYGPCFSINIENITCLFTDKNGDVTEFKDEDRKTQKRIIRGITQNRRAICPMPLFRTLGQHSLTVMDKHDSKYSGIFEVGKQL